LLGLLEMLTKKLCRLRVSMANGRARISYRFRPKPVIREEHEETLFDQLPTNLTLNDYVWEMTAGADNVDLNAVGWKEQLRDALPY